MTKYIAAFALLLCCAALIRLYWIGFARQTRRKKASPPPRKATLFDVKNFLLAGEKEKAVRVYRDIFHVNHAEAVKAVEELEKSLK